MFERMKEDIAAFRDRDPAAGSDIEIVLLYPGYKAIRAYRKAHWFQTRGMKLTARWISQRASRRTGIEIHPGATIGRRFFIDHGTGVVIGETTEIGDDVTLYQGVTLGGTGKDIGKRHPTLGNNVMVGSGAKILGPVTIGDNTRIAAGAVVLKNIPADATAVGVPARIVRIAGKKVTDLDQIHVPDPVEHEITRLRTRIEELEKKLGVCCDDEEEDFVIHSEEGDWII
ncbi:MAG: serine O-acetyltransferase [Clostridia bacterium]|nr:serine O-acetyltransferase [Clostridia bacterium]